jgi:hypothetical protein
MREVFDHVDLAHDSLTEDLDVEIRYQVIMKQFKFHFINVISFDWKYTKTFFQRQHQAKKTSPF